MAFRNPVTSIPAAGIIGLIQGSQLAADSIDGKTITGALIRTAAAGTRWEMDSATYDKLLGFTGDAAEALPAIVAPYASPGMLQIYIASPSIHSGGPSAIIQMIEHCPDGVNTSTEVAINASAITLAGTIITTQPVALVSGSRVTVSGTYVGTPNAAGNFINIPFGVTFNPAPPPPIVTSGSVGVCTCIPGIISGASTFSTTLYDYAGVIITAGARRVNWTVTGILA